MARVARGAGTGPAASPSRSRRRTRSLLEGRSSGFRILRPPSLPNGGACVPCRSRRQWRHSTIVPGYSDGLAPDFHRLPAGPAPDATSMCDVRSVAQIPDARACSRVTRPAPERIGGHLPPQCQTGLYPAPPGRANAGRGPRLRAGSREPRSTWKAPPRRASSPDPRRPWRPTRRRSRAGRRRSRDPLRDRPRPRDRFPRP